MDGNLFGPPGAVCSKAVKESDRWLECFEMVKVIIRRITESSDKAKRIGLIAEKKIHYNKYSEYAKGIV